MARKTEQAPAEDMTTTADVEVIQQATDSQDALNKHLATIDATYGDGLPYDSQRVITETRFYMGASAEAMLEAGKRLILIKEHEQHGGFLSALDKIGLEPRTAQKMMQAAAKFSNAPTMAHLGKTKMLELMAEADDDIQELADGGTLAGKTLDEIDRMTVRELKSALRQSREESAQNKETNETLLKKKDEKINELDKSLHQREIASLDEKVEQLSADLEKGTIKSIGALLDPQVTIQAILELEDAPQHLRNACAQALNRIRTALDEAQDRLGVIDLSSQPGEDDWMKDDAIQSGTS